MSPGSVCVFAGSSPGAKPGYADSARELGRELAARGATLVYGGGSVGLMGELASASLEAGGNVVGVIPQFLLDREVAKLDVSELVVVDTMHERKHGMYERADAFIALPGGLGTLEELFEMLTWLQLGRHRKPVGLLNVDGYYDGLLAFIENTVNERFVKPGHKDLLEVAATPAALLDQLANARPRADADKWMDREPGTGTRGNP